MPSDVLVRYFPLCKCMNVCSDFLNCRLDVILLCCTYSLVYWYGTQPVNYKITVCRYGVWMFACR